MVEVMSVSYDRENLIPSLSHLNFPNCLVNTTLYSWNSGSSLSVSRFEEEVDGFDIYYGTTPQYNEGPYSTPPASFSEENRPPNFSNRGRQRERTWIPGVNFHGLVLLSDSLMRL